MSIKWPIDLYFNPKTRADYTASVEVTLELPVLPRVGELIDLDLFELIVLYPNDVCAKNINVDVKEATLSRYGESASVREWLEEGLLGPNLVDDENWSDADDKVVRNLLRKHLGGVGVSVKVTSVRYCFSSERITLLCEHVLDDA